MNKTKKIAFLCYQDSFNYNKIGGTDAIVRRISNYLNGDNEIFLIHYDLKDNVSVEVAKNITQLYFINFDDALVFVKENNISNTICIYLKPIDRLKLFLFRRKNSHLIFHTLITVFNENTLKRWISFIEPTITYNGNIYCLSSRISNTMKLISKKSLLLLPPVDDSFFHIKDADVKQRKKIRISYMGRLDYGKGADLAFEFFSNSNLDTENYEFYMYAYPWQKDSFSMELHNKLINQNKIEYIETKLFVNPNDVNVFLKQVIDDTDLFYLPYRYMRSTIDAPLVPMEIMSRNKPFITTNIDGIKELAYHTDALLNINELSQFELIEKRIKLVLSKNYKIDDFVCRLKYKTSNIAGLLLKSIFKNE